MLDYIYNLYLYLLNTNTIHDYFSLACMMSSVSCSDEDRLIARAVEKLVCNIIKRVESKKNIMELLN